MDKRRAREHAAKMFKIGKDYVWINPKELNSIKEAITKDDLRELIKNGIIKKKKMKMQSKGRTRKLKEQKKKGRKKGKGKRRAKKSLKMNKKANWINKVRALKKVLKEIRKEKPELVKKAGYSKVYSMIKGNYFRGKKHLTKFIEEKQTVKL